MTPTIYLRSPRPDGYWEGVEPVRTKPDYTSDWEGYKKWHNEIYSLPVTHLIHPELGKANGIGWLVKEWGYKYEQETFDGWEEISKEQYEYTLYNKRIILVGKQPAENKGQEGGDEAAVQAAKKLGIISGPPLSYFIHGWNAAASHPVTDEAKEIERLKARVKELEDLVEKAFYAGKDGNYWEIFKTENNL